MSDPPVRAARRIGALAVAVLVLACAAVLTAPAHAAVYSWTGTWDTGRYGTMELVQNGDRVTGTYSYPNNPGKIDGAVSGSTLRGTWSQGPDYQPPYNAGDIEFVMSADGTTFVGSWAQGTTQFGPGSWNGTRTSAVPPALGPEPALEQPAAGPNSPIARLIRAFAEQVEKDLALALYRPRGAALWRHGDDFQEALAKLTPADAAEAKAKACGLRAGYQWEYHGRQLHNVWTAQRWRNKAKVRRYRSAAAAHLARAIPALQCALGYLPARPDTDTPPTRAKDAAAEIYGFRTRDPATAPTTADVVLPGGTMTNCVANDTLFGWFSFDIPADVRLDVVFSVPGQPDLVESLDGPLAKTFVVTLSHSGVALPNGSYTLTLRVGDRILDRESFTRAC